MCEPQVRLGVRRKDFWRVWKRVCSWVYQVVVEVERMGEMASRQTVGGLVRLVDFWHQGRWMLDDTFVSCSSEGGV